MHLGTHSKQLWEQKSEYPYLCVFVFTGVRVLHVPTPYLSDNRATY